MLLYLKMKCSVVLLGFCVFAGAAAAQNPETKKSDPKAPVTTEPAAKSSDAAAAQRNENVWASHIDNETQKAESARLGSDYVTLTQPVVEANHFASEYGRAPSEILVLNRSRQRAGWHGELFESLRNSVFNARTFFQVGQVMPSRMNNYGARITGKLAGIGSVTGNFSQRKLRGVVNGNVLVLLPSEHTPLVTDPAARAIISRFVAAYPAVQPNRPDFDPRALNTNAPQSMDDTDAGLRIDRDFSAKSQLLLSYSLTRQYIDAFQFVAGRNPDTSIHSHRARITYRYATSDSSDVSVSAGFARTASDLHSEPNAVGPRVRVGLAVEDLGPDSLYPIKRVQNTFRYGVVGYHRLAGGKHNLTFGGDLYRFQVNGIETYNQRGLFSFTSNFGRSAIENLLMGTPTQYEVSIGDMNRGFRNWQANTFFADQWKLNSRLQIYFGLRHSLESSPVEVNGLDQLPYGTDWNNFSPRFSVSYRAAGDWMVRAGYTISYGQILPVTYSQIRYNPPRSVYVIINNPDLARPLAGIDLKAPNVRTSPTILSQDLVSPYTHQYALTLERRFLNTYQIRLGYLGSRSIKMINNYIGNRAVPVTGIPLTTATVNERRPDPRYYDIKHVLNGGIAYLDAAQASFEMPYRKGFAVSAIYTFSKAIDQGSSYMGIGANKDIDQRAQTQYKYLQDRKSLSDFDSPHSLLVYFSYDLPKAAGPSKLLRSVAGGWQISGALMIKKGTPCTVKIGSDAPGLGNVDGSVGDRPNILDPSILGATVGDPDTSTQILRRDRFSYIIPGQDRGNLGYNTFRKDGIENLNASLTKEWDLGSGRTLRFRVEAFNFMNHPQFDQPQYNLSSPAFGKITNTLNDGRIFQFGIRLSF